MLSINDTIICTNWNYFVLIEGDFAMDVIDEKMSSINANDENSPPKNRTK